MTPDHIGVRTIIPMMEVASIEIDEMRKSKIGAVAGFGLLGLAARGVGTAIAVAQRTGKPRTSRSMRRSPAFVRLSGRS